MVLEIIMEIHEGFKKRFLAWITISNMELQKRNTKISKGNR